MKNLWLVVLAFVCVSGPVRADDDGLYDPAPPAGSAFVRFVNVADKQAAHKPSVGSKSYKAIEHGKIGPYVPVKKGNNEVKLNDHAEKYTFEEGMFYTVVLKKAELSVLKDDAIKNSTKAMIAFYNLADQGDLSLRTVKGDVKIVDAVASGKSGYREINAVKVNLAVYKGDEKAADIDPVVLRRREPTSIVVTENADGKLAVQIVRAETDTKQ